MGMFRRDTAVAVAKTRGIISNIEAQLAGLAKARAAALLADDGMVEVEKIDAEIERLHKSAGRHAEQVAALLAAQREQAADDREKARSAAIQVIEKKLAARAFLADSIESAAAKLADLYVSLVAADREMRASYPFPALYWPTSEGLAGQIIGKLHISTRAGGSPGLFPTSTSLFRALNSVIRLEGIASTAADQNSRLLEALRTVPLPEPATDEQEAA